MCSATTNTPVQLDTFRREGEGEGGGEREGKRGKEGEGGRGRELCTKNAPLHVATLTAT